MMLPKILSVLSVFGLIGANAKAYKPRNSSSSSEVISSETELPTSTASSTQASSSDPVGPTLGADLTPKCTLKDSLPEGRVCGELGYVSNTDGAFQFAWNSKSYQACADQCFENVGAGCKTFWFGEGGCRLFANTASKLTFAPKKDNQALKWYEIDCFNCEEKNRLVFADDFSDGDADDWSLTTDDLDDFVFDVQPVSLYNGAKTSTLRILEAGESGVGEIRKDPSFPLEAGVGYRLTFSAMVDPRGAAWSRDDFSPVTIVISNGDYKPIAYVPASGQALGGNWYKWKWSFEVEEGQDGDYNFSVFVDASGFLMDWYIDNIYVEAKA
ncbi:hypothetical protein FZEAL_9213 [Fusarium zealandicum]|uniref:Apple domain-containing protein n=1 Tax=Fusarium zealandicum TaxID=1053134 RepID=A0A8H4XH29_9HYPO|nr:hypothetical protein FZEAL_9213 [Fusarium zealandicum]